VLKTEVKKGVCLSYEPLTFVQVGEERKMSCEILKVEEVNYFS
jgi:hypothetical protein